MHAHRRPERDIATTRSPASEDQPAPWEAGGCDLVEGRDYTLDPRTGGMVLTRAYLLKRGFCCHFGCRECPYGDE